MTAESGTPWTRGAAPLPADRFGSLQLRRLPHGEANPPADLRRNRRLL
jgi:hypothetical protein